MAKRERLEGLREPLGGGHSRPGDEDGDHQNAVPLQRRGDLHPQVVVRIIQAAVPSSRDALPT